MKKSSLLLLVLLAGCNGQPSGYGSHDDGSGLAFAAIMAGLGASLLTAPPAPRRTTTNCSTFGQMGHGFSCTSW